MNGKDVLRVVFFATVLTLALPGSALADDSAASIAAGGLVPRRETRIVMAKEVLRISGKKVVVDYDFRNDTDQDVTTEVAFPIPPYENQWAEGDLAEQSFKSFKVWVDSKPVQYKEEAKAIMNGKDVSNILKADHIDIATYGHFRFITGLHQIEEDIEAPDFVRLSKSEKQQLVKKGLLKDEKDYGSWTVHLQYHWTQSFPAHSTVHIRHEYSPVVGFTQVGPTAVEDLLTQLATGHSAGGDPDGDKLLSEYCADRPFLSTLARALRESAVQAKTADERFYTGIAYPHWVDFILTSANTWQRPIEDFTLIVERGKLEQGEKTLISFCSPANGKVEKLDADHFQVHLTNFVPTSELHIGFFDVPLAKPVQATVKK